MEVAMAEEKKKIFRARKTMKISDRQQLETLHSTLLSAAQQSPNPSPSPPPTAPLVNGTHKEEGPKVAEKEQNYFMDTNSSPGANSPVSPASRGSPPPSLSLNLSPSPTSSQSPKAREDTPPASPFQTVNFDLKNTEEGKKASLPSPSNGCSASPPTERKEGPNEEVVKLEKNAKATECNKKEMNTTKNDAVTTSKDSPKPTISESAPSVKEDDHSAVINSTEPMETDGDTTEAKAPEAPTSTIKEEKTSSSKPGSTSSLVPASTLVPAPSSALAPASPPSASVSSSTAASVPHQEKETKEAAKEVKVEKVKEEKVKDEAATCKEKVKNKGPTKEVKMEVDHVKSKAEVGESSKPSRPKSTPPSDTVVKVEKNPSSQLKRALSEGEKDGVKVEREGKRPKVELEAQLELKITAKKANSLLKLEKIVQQVVAEQLKVFESMVIDKGLQELKDRVEKIECATKHQTSITTLQTKISRIAKKFGEANQASENKRKQEALAAASAKSAAAAATTAAVAAAAAATSGPISPVTPVTHRLVRTPTQTPTTISTTNAISSPRPPTSVSMPTSAPTTLVQQNQILQLITSSSNATSNLATGINTQSPMGTLILKTASGQPMMHGGQPLLIQLPMSMANCQPGTVVNIPASCLPTVNSLNKAKTSTTTTFIIKPAQAMTTAATSVTTTVPAIQAATQMTQMAQMSLARTVYQGGAGGISTTPSSGVTVTTARAPTQPVSVAGAMSSSSSPASSGPAATGSTAPGPPQGTSMTSKTDNQATSSTPAKPALVVGRPKGSVIDLTEDDDDVQVTGVVKNATASPASGTQRPHPVISVPNSAGAKSSQSSGGNPQTTVHHRAPVESPSKSRAVTTSTPTRSTATFLPPLPAAPQPVGRPPAEAAQTSPPQQPQLKLVPSPSGIVLSWCVAETDLTCATVDSYHLYAFHQDNSNSNSATQQHWKKIGEVKALPLPMACTLTQFQAGSTYHFAVRAKDIYGRFGSFCDPQCTNVISPNSG